MAVIGAQAFVDCRTLKNVTIATGVTSIGNAAFGRCPALTSLTIPDSVRSIGELAFGSCSNLASIVIGNSVTNIGNNAFGSCTNLRSVLFHGNAPTLGATVFAGNNVATVYYLPGKTGWGPVFGGRPTAMWPRPYPLILSSGVRTNRFGFMISWVTNIQAVIEASTDLADPAWVPLETNGFSTGPAYFSDPQWTNYPDRFYRVRSP